MSTLNPLHKQALVSGFLDLHRRMAEMEAYLAQSDSSSPFNQHVNDLSPTERKVVQDYFARMRGTMLARLREHGLPLQTQRTSLRWVLQTGLTFLHIAIAELGPGALRGYGTLDEAARRELVQIQQELDRIVDRVGAYLAEKVGHDLAERLARLDAVPATVQTLTLLDSVIARWQLVEFRPTIETILQRLEAPQYEIAVFGRVNSGKSSLLNSIAGTSVLPVGVTPVTAVPTRLLRGEEAEAVVRFAETGACRIDVADLAQYASEQGNPGNYRRVTGIEVRLPAPRLRDGVVLVDTPGIGSLAAAGSAETFAYLPRCDLGVLLIDAAASLDQEDLTLLRTLYEAGTPAQVLLSKADLLTPEDRRGTSAYIQQHIQQELGVSLPVHPVSTRGEDSVLLSDWFEHEIEPLLGQQRQLTEASLKRKIAQVLESVTGILETMFARRSGGQLPMVKRAAQRAANPTPATRRLLDQVDVEILRAEKQCREWNERSQHLAEIILDEAAKVLVKTPKSSRDPPGKTVSRVSVDVMMEVGKAAGEVVTELKRTFEETLQSLATAAGSSAIDLEPLKGYQCRGLPAPEPSPLLHTMETPAPWWSFALPGLALGATRRSLQKKVGAAILEQARLHNSRVRAWLKETLKELVERYQSQAEVIREQMRRIEGSAPTEEEAVDLDALRQDLERLRSAKTQGLPGDGPPRDNRRQVGANAEPSMEQGAGPTKTPTLQKGQR
jgi:GTP-binding protein EngB required for normal cell division